MKKNAVPRLPRMIVDAHHHLWELGTGAHYPWLQDGYDPERAWFGEYPTLCRDFPIEAYRARCSGFMVTASVHVEAERAHAQAIDETRWLHEVAARDGLPSVVVAWTDLLAPDAARRVDEQAAWPRVRGIRFKPHVTNAPGKKSSNGIAGTLLDPRWPVALDLLKAKNLCWDLRVPFWHLEEAAAMLAHAPRISVVLEHAGLPWDRSNDGLAMWRRGMEALAAHSNVTVKLSEFGLRATAWNEAENQGIVHDTISIFGWQRCMFGSNLPVANLRIGFPALIRMIAGALAHLSESEQQGIWHDNALRVYRIADVPRK